MIDVAPLRRALVLTTALAAGAAPTASGRVADPVALAVGFGPQDGVSRPALHAVSAADPGVDATSDAEARQLRGATHGLAAELTAAARCHTSRFAACVTPALRHGGIGGRTTAMLARVVMADVAVGPCRTYLLGLQAANEAAGDETRWLLALLYGPDRRRHQHEIASQLALGGGMLRRAARAGAGGCTPLRGGRHHLGSRAELRARRVPARAPGPPH
jgi:hypothetical protein